jgi:acylphosphatase
MKLRIKITGPKIHDVGYRYLLLGGAMGLRLPGFDANNLTEGKDQVLDIVVEGKDSQIEAFRTFVETHKPSSAEVSCISVSDYDGEVMRIAEYSQVLTAMQMLKAIPTILEIAENTKLIPEIAENTRLIPEIAENTRLIPQIANNTKPTPKILEEIMGLRDDIQPGFAILFRQVQVDVKAIKERLGMS